jgi:hypothetical protein
MEIDSPFVNFDYLDLEKSIIKALAKGKKARLEKEAEVTPFNYEQYCEYILKNNRFKTPDELNSMKPSRESPLLMLEAAKPSPQSPNLLYNQMQNNVSTIKRKMHFSPKPLKLLKISNGCYFFN